MKTVYFKTAPRQYWQKPTYYKIVGRNNDITVISVWNASSLEHAHIDDETFNGYLEYVKLRDLNNPLVDISRNEFDEQYIMLMDKLNLLTSV